MTTAFTPNVEAHANLGALASRLVQTDKLPWTPVRFKGCYVKTLLVDKASGIATLLMKMDPGAGLPDHEHVLIEQTYMIEGRLVDAEGPDKGVAAGPGDFIWRPAGSRHSVIAPEGALMIAMFQIPNKFFEKDGSIVDQFGEDWGLKWDDLLEKKRTISG